MRRSLASVSLQNHLSPFRRRRPLRLGWGVLPLLALAFAEPPAGAQTRASDLGGTVAPPTDLQTQNLGAGWPGKAPASSLPELPPAQLGQLTMQQAVVFANERNPVVRSAYQNLIATQNSLGASFARWWPQLNVSLNGGLYGQRDYYNYAGAFMGGSSGGGDPASSSSAKAFSGSYFQSIGQVDITWNLIDPSRSPAIWQAKYQVRQAADAYVIAWRDNRLQTETSYVDLQAAFAQLEASRPIVENDRLLVRLALSKVKQGVASKLDVAKQKTVLFSDEVTLEKANQNVAIARANLATLLNTTQSEQMTPAAPLVPIGSWPHSLEETIRASEAYRKVIEQRLLDVMVNEAQAKIFLATYRPTLQLVNTLYWTKGVGYTSVGPTWVQGARSDSWNGSSLLQLTFTGFDGGQARMNAEASKRKAQAAMETYLATVNDVRRDAQVSFAQAESGRRIVITSANEVHQANEAIRLQALRFSAGYGTVTDVVQAQQNLAQSVISYIQNLAAYNKALLTLSRNTGLDYQADPELVRQVGEPLNLLRLPSVLERFR